MNTNPSVSPASLSLIRIPAAITLGVTLLRLVLELTGAPGWLASDAAGGGRAVLGIAWLPLLFGPWFAFRIRPHVTGTWSLVKRLAKTLLLYGLAARIPVALISIPAILGNWGTHYDKVGTATGSVARIAVAFGAQLVFWACVWTVVTGTLAGLIALAVRSRAPGAHQRVATAGGAGGQH